MANDIGWVLVAADPAAKATGLLPILDNTSDPDYYVHTYRRADLANADSTITITVQYGSDLGAWTNALYDGTDVIILSTE